MNRVEFARTILEAPEYFAYFGDRFESDGWGRVFSQHRDSDVLERANWQAVCARMDEFTEDWAIERSSHWAVGWVEQGRVRVYDPDTFEFTAAFEEAYEIMLALQDYPVLDDDLYSEMEAEEEEDEV